MPINLESCECFNGETLPLLVIDTCHNVAKHKKNYHSLIVHNELKFLDVTMRYFNCVNTFDIN